jgi:L-lactate dehydrogenase complex protein LldG
MTATSARLTKGNGTAREEIFASIRRHLAASKPFDALHKHHASEAAVPGSQPVDQTVEELIDVFRMNLESVGGTCHVVSDEREAARILHETIGSPKATQIAISDSELVKRLIGSNTDLQFVENAAAELLFDCDLGITSSQWAIAETGTLVLESEKESHRLTSLVPANHLCIIKASTIRQTLGEILELTKQDLSRTITFITGASRTSDIELTLAIGVHGPKELHVIVIANE